MVIFIQSEENDDYLCPDIMIICDRKYLKDGAYVLEQSYMLQDDVEEEHYNAKTEISLRAFPHIKMLLEELFEGIDWTICR